MTAEQKKAQFTLVYSELTDDIFRYFLFRVYDREAAKELAQDTFIKAWKYIADGKEVQNLKAFIYKIAYHLVIDSSKKKKDASLDQLLEDGFTIADEKTKNVTAIHDCLAAFQEIDKLGDEYKEVLLLRYVEGLGVNDIAETLGISESLVSVRIHRALKQLRITV